MEEHRVPPFFDDLPEEEDRKSLFFLLSLVLHLVLIYLCFLFISYQKSNKTAAITTQTTTEQLGTAATLPGQEPQPGEGSSSEQPPLPEQKPKNEELAELRARQSAFGAPVVFADMPESTPAVASNETEDGTGDESESAKQTEMQETVAKVEQKEEEKANQKEIEHIVSEALALKESEKSTTLAQTFSTFVKKRPIISSRPAPRKKKRNKNNEGNATRSAGPISKRFTFADLTNGFMENLQAGGKDLINQRGDPNKRPSHEQLKHASYFQQIAWHLQAAFKRASRRTKFIVPAPRTSAFQCTFHIAKSGELEKLVVGSSTGHQELDAYIVSSIKDAFPLPPIPDHWQQPSLVQTWVFRNVHPDESSYHVNF